MMNLNLYDEYLNGRYLEVWDDISSLAYDNLQEEERAIVIKIIKEALSRIDHNVAVVQKILRDNGFDYINFGDINPFDQPHLLRDPEDYDGLIQELTKTDPDQKIPLFFASFSSFFKVIDFRGLFKQFEVEILLDALFIESPSNLKDVEDRKFELVYQGEPVFGCLVSPDAYVKENTSGDLGPCILLNKETLVDNFIINYSEDMPMTFVEYLRFCFHWACFPNLFWVSEEEREPFQPILKQVRENLKQF